MFACAWTNIYNPIGGSYSVFVMLNDNNLTEKSRLGFSAGGGITADSAKEKRIIELADPRDDVGPVEGKRHALGPEQLLPAPRTGPTRAPVAQHRAQSRLNPKAS